MSTNATSRPRSASTERTVAVAETLTPIVTGLLAPLCDGGATFVATTAYGIGASLVAANYMNRIPQQVLDQMPAGDILDKHRTTMGISALTTGMALAIGTLQGPEGADALMAGIAAIPDNPVPGILSLGWWAAVALVPLKLRTVFARKTPATARTHAKTTPAAPDPLTDQIKKAWGRYISHPDNGRHKHQILTRVTVHTDPANPSAMARWSGTIQAPAGVGVSVSKDTVSSVYRRPKSCIELKEGAHAGEVHVTVTYQKAAALDTSTLEGAWLARAARPGGIMPNTHLENVTYDPNTEGQSAYVCADEDLDALEAPDRNRLAGALRTAPLLVSYEPIANNPRKAILRTMPRNPLEKGRPFTGLDALKASPGGRFRIGGAISGHPSLLQLYDPKLGAIHLVIAGTTGSGKGGAAQMTALGCHANGYAMIYADPKGASNPAIPKMAAYSGLQQHGSLGALRIHYALLKHREEEAARYDLKNFTHSKMRPLTATILDEAGQMLSTGMPNRKEAVAIVKAGASLGRSFGMPLVLINQVINLDQIGGEQAIRANLIKGGSWLILRTDSDQTNLSDLPPGFEGIDPGMIPAVWSADNDSLIYDESIPEDDPARTFGLGYLAAAGGRPGMMRIDMLEDATPHIDPDQVAIPEDFPDWDDNKLEEIANTPIPGFEESSGDIDDSPAPAYTPGVDLPKKELPAEDKILKVLREYADPMHLEALAGDQLEDGDYDIQYVDRQTLLTQTGLNENTLTNTCGRMVRADRIHRQGNGYYAIGPDPKSTQEQP